MKLSELIDNLPFGTKDVEITNVTSDSRKVGVGTLFVCIKGLTVDGHDFAKDAANKGASAVIVDHNVGIDCQVVMEDTREVYSKACAAFFGNPAEKLKIIGITGTNGKTTTTFLLKSVLESFGKKVGLIGTINNIIGDRIIESENTTPDAYQLHRLFKEMVDESCEYCVMEVSSHALDQKRVSGFMFDVGVFTNLTQDHLDYHKTLENYLDAKLKLFKMSKISVVNNDDNVAQKVINASLGKVYTYAVNNSADFVAKGINYKSNGAVYEMLGPDAQICRVKTQTPGRFSVYNSLSAAVAVISLGFDFYEVAQNMAKCIGIKGRAEVVETGRDFTVIIDYAHTPDGIENILNAMNEVKEGRLVCLFGCGGDRDATKRPLMASAAAKLADYCIITSDNPRTEQPHKIIEDILVGMKGYKTPYKVIENRAEAIKFAIDNAQTNDIIVLAGKGHETYQVLGKEKVHFDEREVVAEALK